MIVLMHNLFIATVSEETHRAFLLNFQLFTILRLEDQGPEEALTSKQGTRSQSADTAYPLPQILAIFGAGRSIFAFMIPVFILQDSLLGSFLFGRAPRQYYGYCLSFITNSYRIWSRQVYFCILDFTAILILHHDIACLAHYILVVGRFTGIESSHCSFLTIKHWLASHL
jgi:hypothetical protein